MGEKTSVTVFSLKGGVSMLCFSGLLCKRAERRIRGVHRTSCKADGSFVEVLFP